jgi:hypothetical protein
MITFVEEVAPRPHAFGGQDSLAARLVAESGVSRKQVHVFLSDERMVPQILRRATLCAALGGAFHSRAGVQFRPRSRRQAAEQFHLQLKQFLIQDGKIPGFWDWGADGHAASLSRKGI